MTVGERIKVARENSRLSQVELAEKINVSKQTLYKYENNIITNIPSNKIEEIAQVCSVSPAYLMGWDNCPSVKDNQTLQLREQTIVLRPLYNSVAAGFGAIPDDNVIGYIPTNIKVLSEQDLYIWVNVKGDSMAPTIEDGSEILIRKQSSVDSGQIAVVLIDGEEAVVKKIVYGPDWIELRSFNPYYPPRRFEGREVQRITVLGLVKKVSMSLN